MRTRPMTTLVTGGAGFLGSHLCDRLIADGHHVICLDDLSTGSIANIEHLLRHERFEFVRHDVEEPYARKVEQIFHLASPASPPQYQRDPIKTTRTNVLGMLNMLELARQNRCPILQASTSEVYGDPEVHPQPEVYWGNVNPIGVRACYDEAKRVAETLCFDYRRSHGVDVKVVRIFNTYGPRLDLADGRVVSNFIVQALRGEDLTVYGDGSQTRSFCYVSDLIEGFVRMMATPADIGGPVNLGNPGEFTMLELANLVIEATGSASRIVHRPLPLDDPKVRRPDISRAQRLLDWEPEISLREGLRRTIRHFAQRLTAVAV